VKKKKKKQTKDFFTYVSFLPTLAIFKKIKRKKNCLNISNPFSPYLCLLKHKWRLIRVSKITQKLIKPRKLKKPNREKKPIKQIKILKKLTGSVSVL